MGAVASGVLVAIGSAVLIALAIGGIGGTIAARTRGNVFVALVAATAVYVGVFYAAGYWSAVGLAIVGFLPLTATLLLSHLIVSSLMDRTDARPALPIIAGLGAPLIAGACYSLLFRAGLDPLGSSLWLSGAILCFLIFGWAFRSKRHAR